MCQTGVFHSFTSLVRVIFGLYLEYLIAYNCLWVLLIWKYVASCEGGTVWSHAHIWSDHQKHPWITADKFTCSKHRHSFKHLQETPKSPVVVKRPDKSRQQWVTVFYRWHTKKQLILDQFITKADVSPSGKWHLSHFSLRWVCEWCLQPSIMRELSGGWGCQRAVDTLGSLLLNLLMCYLTPWERSTSYKRYMLS